MEMKNTEEVGRLLKSCGRELERITLYKWMVKYEEGSY